METRPRSNSEKVEEDKNLKKLRKKNNRSNSYDFSSYKNNEKNKNKEKNLNGSSSLKVLRTCLDYNEFLDITKIKMSDAMIDYKNLDIGYVIPNPKYFNFDLLKLRTIRPIIYSKKYGQWKTIRFLYLGMYDKGSKFSILCHDVINQIRDEVLKLEDDNKLNWWHSFKIGNKKYYSLETFSIDLLEKSESVPWKTSKINNIGDVIYRPVSALEAASNIESIVMISKTPSYSFLYPIIDNTQNMNGFDYQSYAKSGTAAKISNIFTQNRKRRIEL